MTVNILCTVYTWGGNKLDTSLCEMSGGCKGKAEREVRRVGRHSRRKIRDSNNMPERKAKKDDETRPREGWQKSWLFKKGYYKTEINCNLLTYYFKRCEKNAVNLLFELVGKADGRRKNRSKTHTSQK